MKINKKTQCKEFYNNFHFVGQIKCHARGSGDHAEIKPIYATTQTKTHKPRRVLVFDLLTAKYNKLKIDLSGMEFDSVTLYSSTAKQSYRIPWADRLNKSKYPDQSYTVIGGTDWDNCELWGNLLSEGMWVEVKGKYEFDTYQNDEGKTFLTIRRKPTSISTVKDGQEIILHTKERINYVCDFDHENFQEVNGFNLELGIKSVYQDDATRDVKVNGVFLANGKNRSVPKDIELKVYYKQALPGKQSLADAFTKLNRLDFVKVHGVDNNRPEFGEVEVETGGFDPFVNVDEKEANIRRAITGSRRGLEISAVVSGTVVRSMLTDAEITEDEPTFYVDEDTFGDEDVPF